MEKNYDELIADMLIQMDFHTQELTKQSLAMENQSLALEKQSLNLENTTRESAIIHAEQTRINQEIRSDIEKMGSMFVEQLVHSATILDRIIKKNNLKV